MGRIDYGAGWTYSRIQLSETRAARDGVDEWLSAVEVIRMNAGTVGLDEEISKWDVALESLAREECRKTGHALQLEDFRRLARDYEARLDDIMVTMFELVIQGQWRYRDEQGVEQPFERETLDALYVNRRLRDEDLTRFSGSWEPRE